MCNLPSEKETIEQQKLCGGSVEKGNFEHSLNFRPTEIGKFFTSISFYLIAPSFFFGNENVPDKQFKTLSFSGVRSTREAKEKWVTFCFVMISFKLLVFLLLLLPIGQKLFHIFAIWNIPKRFMAKCIPLLHQPKGIYISSQFLSTRFICLPSPRLVLRSFATSFEAQVSSQVWSQVWS